MDKNIYKPFMEAFLKQNSIINLISKKDEKYLWEKHVFDSLAIDIFFKKHTCKENIILLDIGTGGGFPAIPIALAYPNVKVYALDSIRKKIRAIENIKSELDIQNLYPICDRAENIKETYDIITSRAVAPLDKICSYSLPLLKSGGYFIAYKSVKTPQEISNAEKILKKHKAKITEIIEYELPLKENYTRNLIVISK